MDASQLDSPTWISLGGPHAALGLHHPLARRYRREITPLGGVESPGWPAMEALATLTDPNELLYTAENELKPLPPCWSLEGEKLMHQMVLSRAAEEPDSALKPVVLTLADAADMSELATLTHPGPFGPELVRLGFYVGLRDQGRLIAMAGQRRRIPGYVEVSGVCTHPDWQGRGLARALMNCVAREIQRHGETPWLNVLEENIRARALYERMGYVFRKRLFVRAQRRVA